MSVGRRRGDGRPRLGPRVLGATLGRFARRSLPTVEGTLRLACLEAPAEVLRGPFGVAHVYARSRLDLARAQGYVHAQDRLFQMELMRRRAFGTLSEVFGARTLRADRFARRLRLRWAAEQEAAALDPSTRAVVDAYCEGVNAYVEAGPLPFELRLLRVRPARWAAVDVQAPVKLLNLALAENWQIELLRRAMIEEVGEERARVIEGRREAPATSSAGGRARGRPPGASPRGGGSNGWLVAGSRTATGSPLLANDPHLPLGAPAIWHVQHLDWDGGDAVGLTVPGAPAVVIGRNREVAWGMTNALIDIQDAYVESFSGDDPTSYLADGTWLHAEVVREEIRVRGRRKASVEDVLVTRHGPVVEAPDPDTNEALALRWSALEPGETLRSLLELASAASVEEAEAALDRLAGPPQNVLLADVSGTIGYRLAGGPIPVREPGAGRAPTPGSTSTHEWRGWVAADAFPRARDPVGGVVVSANQPLQGLGEDERFPGEHANGYRARRIESLLAGLHQVSAADCRRVQLDQVSLPGLELAGAVRDVEGADALEAAALAALRTWDGTHGTDGAASAVYGVLIRKLQEEALAELGPTLRRDEAWLHERTRPAILRLLAERDDSFFADGRTWEEVVREALRGTVAELGPDPARWRWGDRHRVAFEHPLSSLPLLGRLLTRGPYPVGGDADTVWQMACTDPDAAACIGPTARVVFDLADVDSTALVVPPGQSGHVASPHYDDQLAPWFSGSLVSVAMTRGGVEATAEARLRLEP